MESVGPVAENVDRMVAGHLLASRTWIGVKLSGWWVDARRLSGSEPRHTYPIVREMEFDGGASVGVLDLERWAAHFVLRYAVFPSVDEPTIQPDTEALHLGVWEASDERGQSYTGVGGSAEGQTGDMWTWVGEVLFVPALQRVADICGWCCRRATPSR